MLCTACGDRLQEKERLAKQAAEEDGEVEEEGGAAAPKAGSKKSKGPQVRVQLAIPMAGAAG